MRIEDQRGGNGSVPGTRRKAVPIAMATGPAEYTAGQQELPGKLAEGWDANTGLRASCPNFQPKNDGPKVRHDFHFLAPCV